MTKMLDQLLMMIEGTSPPPPIATLIGFTLRSIKPEEGVIDFVADERHVNQAGTLHGGVLCDITDAAMGLATSPDSRNPI